MASRTAAPTAAAGAGVGVSRHRASTRLSESHFARQRGHLSTCDIRSAHVDAARSPSRCRESMARTSGQPPSTAAGGSPNAGSRRSRSASRARWSRLFTAATPTPSMAATSGAVSPCTSRSSNTSRSAGLSDRQRGLDCRTRLTSGERLLRDPAPARRAPGRRRARARRSTPGGRVRTCGAGAASDARPAGDGVDPRGERRVAAEPRD